MPKFLCLQRKLPSPDSANSAEPSPAQMADMYAQFNAWRERHAASLVDLGGKLGSGKVVSAESADGPFVEVKELVGGYMIVEAEDLEAAATIAGACPGLVRPGSGVEVIEIHVPGA